MRLLIVDDDVYITSMLSKWLRKDGYAVDVAPTCRDAEGLLEMNPYDLLILDWNLPDEPGVHLCRQVRDGGSSVPILMVSGRTSDEEKVAGLDAGADDYLTKPYKLDELRARLRALLRRQTQVLQMILKVADVRIDVGRREVSRAGQLLTLTAKEYAMMEYFVRNAGRVVTRVELWNHLWDDNHDPASHALEVHINNLRSKLSINGGVELIHTRRGHGYVFGPGRDRGADEPLG